MAIGPLPLMEVFVIACLFVFYRLVIVRHMFRENPRKPQ